MKLKAFDGQVKCQVLSGFCLMFRSCRRELVSVSPRWCLLQCRMDRWNSFWGLLYLFLVLCLPVERYLLFVDILYDCQNSRIYWVYTNKETRGENVSLKTKLDGLFGKCSSHLNNTLVLQSGKFSGSSPATPSQPQGLSYAEDAAEHENMKAVLKTSSPAVEDATPVLGVRTRSRASRGNFWWVGFVFSGRPCHRNGPHCNL